MTYDDFMKRLAVSLFSVFWVYGVYSMLTRPESRFDGFLTIVVILSVVASLAITKLGCRKVSLYDYGKWILAGFGAWMVFRGLTSYESRVEGAVAAIAAVAIVVAIIIALARRKWRDEREGFSVYSYGGPDGGVVVYREADRSLNLIYSQRRDTVFIPSDPKWKQVMPEWSRERKGEIIARIKQRHGKRLIGKPIVYEESDADEDMPLLPEY
jgi:hypothetical protein